MARRNQKAFVPRQEPKKSVQEVKRIETTIASTEEIYDDDDGCIRAIKITCTNGSRYTLKREEEAFSTILWDALEGDPITLLAYASKIIAVEYHC